MHAISMLRVLGLALLTCLASCAPNERVQHDISGRTMGTRYAITVVARGNPPAALPGEIQALLDAVDWEMSTYDDDSLLSQFNRHVSTDWYPVSATLCSAVEGALDIAKQTDGAFDITLGRVVNLWGFGPDTPVDNVPENPDIIAALDTAGYRKLHTDCSKKRLRKDHPGLYVDLSAYAKGLAADLVGKLLAENDIDDYLVEIGGEIRTSGLNGRAEPWRVAIELPDSAGRAVEAILHVSNLAVATSGDYRNYFEVGGVRYSHAIDGRTGAPVTHSTSSVTVVNESAAVADSLATALLVMGHGQGLAFAEANGIAAVFIVRKASGFETLASPLATPYLD